MMDIIIIGAGAAGLMAAKLLSAKGKKVLVLEARERLGGRILTNENTFSSNAEAGAEFIHGNLKLTKKILKEAGLKQTKITGGIYRLKNGKLGEENDFTEGWAILIKRLKELETDMTVKEFLDKHLSEKKYAGIKRSFVKYVQGYDAADINLASALSITEEMENEEDDQFRIEMGYGGLINFLAKEIIKNGGEIKTSETVKEIHWEKDSVEVITPNKVYKSQKVVITVPLGVLQAKEIEQAALRFLPEIPEHRQAIAQLGFGGVIKILFEFDEPFWFDNEFLKAKKINDPFFIFADTFIPTWWTQLPDKKPLLVGWLAGPDSYQFSKLTEDELFEKGIISLAKIFGMKAGTLRKKIRAFKVFNWVTDAFCKGGYSYSTVGTKPALEILKVPTENTIYFAGEAFAKEGTATVDAALHSGKEVASMILKSKVKKKSPDKPGLIK